MIQFNGREITADGFTAETFQRALDRAASEGLRAERAADPETVAVVSGDRVYQTTRQSCTCTAGRFHKPCKHLAFRLFLTDGLGMDLSKGVASARLRPQVVRGITGSSEPKTLAQKVRQGGRATKAGCASTASTCSESGRAGKRPGASIQWKERPR